MGKDRKARQGSDSQQRRTDFQPEQYANVCGAISGARSRRLALGRRSSRAANTYAGSDGERPGSCRLGDGGADGHAGTGIVKNEATLASIAATWSRWGTAISGRRPDRSGWLGDDDLDRREHLHGTTRRSAVARFQMGNGGTTGSAGYRCRYQQRHARTSTGVTR